MLYAPDGTVLTVDQLRRAAAVGIPMEPGARSTLPHAIPPPDPGRTSLPFSAAIPWPAPQPTLPSPSPPVIPPDDATLSVEPSVPGTPHDPAATGFSLGSTGRAVTIFADPGCPFSRSTVARFAHAALEGAVRLTVVPVALLSADSAHQALAAVENGAEAWFARAAVQPTPATAAAVRGNNAAHGATGLGVVPVRRPRSTWWSSTS